MNLKEIRQECWDAARDIAPVDKDRLWPVLEMNRYINRVYRHIARETRCIRDALTPAVCLITSSPVDYTTYEAGTIDYLLANDPNSWLYHANVCPYVFPLHEAVLQVDEAKWTSRWFKLRHVSVSKWQGNVMWEQTRGVPTEFATDYSNKTLVVNFRDEATDTLRLTVRRLPLSSLSSDTDVPEFREHYHDFFINGVLALMYQKQDSEAFDGAKYNNYQQAFLADLDEIKQQENLLDERLRPNASLDAFR